MSPLEPLHVIAALLAAQVLPGALLVAWWGLGRDGVERFVLSAVMGGPLAAWLYLLSIKADSDLLYWTLLGMTDALALTVVLRRWTRHRREGAGSRLRRVPRGPLAGVFLLLISVEAAYFTTTGYLFRLDESANLVMDRALQRDTLFHVGMVRSLACSYPPELLSMSGVRASYHVGYHLQLAAWMRFFGIDAFDGVYRVGAGWSLALLVLSAFVLGRRFAGSDGTGLLISLLMFGTGLGFLFAASPAEWWSLLFMDAALVSVFLPNPLLPAVALLLVGLCCLSDDLEEPRPASLAGACWCLASLFMVKIFVGVQVLAALALAAASSRAAIRRRLVKVSLALLVVSVSLGWPALAASGGGNTAVTLRPLEIARYSMELLDWGGAVEALAKLGGTLPRAPEPSDWGVALAATVLWAVGFLGIRCLGLKALFRDVAPRAEPLRRLLAFFVLAGFPPALLLRIAPADAVGVSRLEAINDAFWFAVQGAMLLWLWTATVLSSWWRDGGSSRRLAAIVLGALAFPCTVQHFVHKQSMEVDRLPADVVEAAGQARRLSAASEVWVEPPDRVHPSPLAYLSGRPVVYDGYVGYDYMFAPRVQRELRRHAVAQFWRSDDAAFQAWFLDHYSVSGVYATRPVPLPAASREWVKPLFANGTVRLYRVERRGLDGVPIVTPAGVPLGSAGAAFFGRGWGRPSAPPRTRPLLPGTAELYLPVEHGASIELDLFLRTPHAAGRLRAAQAAVELAPFDDRAILRLGDLGEGRGLRRIAIEWSGAGELIVERLETLTGSAAAR